MSETPKARAPRAAKLDQACADAVELARAAAEETCDPAYGVGEYLGCTAEAERLVTHNFACTHAAYQGWRWAVTVVRASRARKVTVNEVVLLPGADALIAPAWIPWNERLEGGDLSPGALMPTADNDPRLEPGFSSATTDVEPADASMARIVAAELGLGRERVMGPAGRDDAAERWLAGDGGPDNEMTRQAAGVCETCGYFVRLSGSLGTMFGACANEYSPSDAHVVSVDHGCGGHSDVTAPEREPVPAPVWDTISLDESLFD